MKMFSTKIDLQKPGLDMSQAFDGGAGFDGADPKYSGCDLPTRHN